MNDLLQVDIPRIGATGLQTGTKAADVESINKTGAGLQTLGPVQQSEPEKSSRIFGGGSGACIFGCLPAFGTPYYAACRIAWGYH